MTDSPNEPLLHSTTESISSSCSPETRQGGKQESAAGTEDASRGEAQLLAATGGEPQLEAKSTDDPPATHGPENAAEGVEEFNRDGPSGVTFVPYESELQLPHIMRLMKADLSEPYSIYTYRYFIHNWPNLCFLVGWNCSVAIHSIANHSELTRGCS